MPQKKIFSKRSFDEEEEEGDQNNASEDEEERSARGGEILAEAEERKSGILAIIPTVQTGAAVVDKGTDKVEADGEKEQLVLQDTFAQEIAVMVEYPNILNPGFGAITPSSYIGAFRPHA